MYATRAAMETAIESKSQPGRFPNNILVRIGQIRDCLTDQKELLLFMPDDQTPEQKIQAAQQVKHILKNCRRMQVELRKLYRIVLCVN